jgi:hypothetical protein
VRCMEIVPKKYKEGKCRMKTRFDIIQYGYAVSRCLYIECLEINNPPDGRCGFIIHYEDLINGSKFIEWETLEDALNAFKQFLPIEDMEQRFSQLKGFKRRVVCGSLSPWFYAGEKQIIEDDFAKNIVPNGNAVTK